VADALRNLRCPQIRVAILLGVAMWVLWSLRNFPHVLYWAETDKDFHLIVLGAAIDYQIKAFVLLVAIVIADRAVDDGAPHRRTYVLAALLGGAAAVVVSELFVEPWRVVVLGEDQNRPADISWIRYYSYWPIGQFAILLMTGAPAVFLYADRRAAKKTEAILHAAELDRVRRSRIALESRLAAMQARVEPQFLFNTLDQVEHLYAQDPARGGRMLDDLIAYLRAAMPLMRDTSSTVAQELELARSHLDIAKMRLGNRLAFDIEVPAGLGSARLPPMMLLPLLDHALGHGLARNGSDGTIRIGVGVEAGRLSLRIADTAAGFVTEAGGAGIASLRERLHALYGSDARLGLRTREGGGSEAVIHVPYEIGAAATA
jgi:hypothetical protein